MLTRTTTFKAALLASVGVFALASGEARATVVTSGCVNTNISCTLAELFGGGSIQVDDKIFENWAPTSLDAAGNFVFSTSAASGVSTPPPLADPAQIQVSGIEGASPGVRYTPSGDTWSVSTTAAPDQTGGVNQRSSFGYTVRIDLGLAPNLRIHDNELELFPGANGFAAPFSDAFAGGGSTSIDVKEEVFAGALDPQDLPLMGTSLGFKNVFDAQSSSSASDTVFATGDLFDDALFDPQTAVTVLTSVFVNAFVNTNNTGQSVTASAAVGTLEQRFSQVSVPEPASLGLLGAGLSVLAFLRRRRERKN